MSHNGGIKPNKPYKNKAKINAKFILYVSSKFILLILFQSSRFQNYSTENHILVSTFSGDSHFNPYILFLPLLVFILKNASCFGPCRYIRNGESKRGKWQE